MTHPPDPFERLRAADPAGAEDSENLTSQDLERIYQEITSSDSPTPRLNRRRRSVLILVGAAIVVAAAYIVFSPVTEPLHVACYGNADLTSEAVVVDAPADGDAVEACLQLWGPEGEFGATLDRGPAPDLVSCVLESGAIAVFPTTTGNRTCAELGLGIPDSESQDDSRAVIELRDELVEAFLDNCLDVDEARTLTEDAIIRHGLDGWRVTTPQPFTSDRPCASLAFDVPNNTIELVPISR